jgi:tetratricopeptide (TPR) repeat protein
LAGDWNEVVRIGSTMSISAVADAWTAYRLGEGYLTLGEVQTAVDWLERSVALAPEHLRFQTKLGSAYLALGRFDDSRNVLDRVLEATPSSATAWNDRGFVRLNQGDIEGGEEDFRQALLLDPDLEEALGNLASLLFNTGRAAEAGPLANQLLFLNPQSPEYRQFWEAVTGAAASGQ